jgi:hypothetical protein
MDTSDIITLIIAAYGAVLATVTAVVDLRTKLRRVKVTLSHGFLGYGSHVSDTQLIMEAANLGSRPVTIVAMGILLPDKEKLYAPYAPGQTQLPVALAEGENCRTWVGARECAAQLPGAGYSGRIKLRAFADDTTGKRHVSKAVSFDVDGFIRNRR